jgi:hypothetical protein
MQGGDCGCGRGEASCRLIYPHCSVAAVLGSESITLRLLLARENTPTPLVEVLDLALE